MGHQTKIFYEIEKLQRRNQMSPLNTDSTIIYEEEIFDLNDMKRNGIKKRKITGTAGEYNMDEMDEKEFVKTPTDNFDIKIIFEDDDEFIIQEDESENNRLDFVRLDTNKEAEGNY
eukprot:204383_1